MPNWCSNTVVVSGDAAEVAKFNEWLDDGKALLTKIKPTPQALCETMSGFHGDTEEQKKLEDQEQSNLEQFGHKNWYDWNIANWGTKWDVDVDIDDASSINEQVIFSFESAWSPPQRAIATLSAKFPSLKIRHAYLEEGCGFVGYDEYEKGELAKEEYNENYGSDAWKTLAFDEFGWEPWPDDADELEENEEGKATETPKPAEKPAKKKVKKNTKKTVKKTVKKKSKAKKKKN